MIWDKEEKRDRDRHGNHAANDVKPAANHRYSLRSRT